MAQQPVRASAMLVQVLAADGTTWIQVEGVTGLTPDPSADEVMADKTTYGTAGHAAKIKTQVGSSLGIAYQKYADDITGARAPGQLRIETLSAGLGAAGLGQIRLRETTDTQWARWPEAAFSVAADSSTGVSDLRAGAYTITRNAFPVLEAV